jgi:hypothetical protein
MGELRQLEAFFFWFLENLLLTKHRKVLLHKLMQVNAVRKGVPAFHHY